MSMIKCPICEKEISDKAEQCVHCGAVLRTKDKKVCQECGTELPDNAKMCPKCGCPIENKDKKHNLKIKKQKLLIGLSVICILIIFVLYFTLFRHNDNIFEEYTDYIGKSYKKLPNSYENIRIVDGFCAARCELSAEEINFIDIDSIISYSYFDDKDYSLNKKDEIFAMSWRPQDDSYCDTEEIMRLLTDTYGKYDSEKILDNTSKQYEHKDDTFSSKKYIWNNQNGLEIYFSIDKDGEYITGIDIMWRKVSE